MRLAVLFIVALTTTAVTGQTMYKCVNAGKVEYTGKPCTTGVEGKRIAADAAPSQEDRMRAQMRFEADRDRAAAADLAVIESRNRRVAAARESGQKPAVPDDPANERITTHDQTGWDRKTRGQIAAERRAEKVGIAAGDADAKGPPTVPEASASDPKAWQNERVLTHTQRGWDRKTRGQLVQEKANDAYREAKDPIVVCVSGGCTDTLGRLYSGGPVFYERWDGTSCTRSGTMMTCDARR
jgi:hypothetical protein